VGMVLGASVIEGENTVCQVDFWKTCPNSHRFSQVRGNFVGNAPLLYQRKLGM